IHLRSPRRESGALPFKVREKGSVLQRAGVAGEADLQVQRRGHRHQCQLCGSGRDQRGSGAGGCVHRPQRARFGDLSSRTPQSSPEAGQTLSGGLRGKYEYPGGPGLAGLRTMTRDKRLDDMVTFTGRIPDEQLLEILSTADVCVNPDRPCEMNDISTMIKIMEYMALGKPIVQFDLREGRFSAQDAALYADTQNQVADFAAKILWLLDHAEERKRRGEFGRRRVEQELAWQYSVENLLAAYQRAFSKRGA